MNKEVYGLYAARTVPKDFYHMIILSTPTFSDSTKCRINSPFDLKYTDLYFVYFLVDSLFSAGVKLDNVCRYLGKIFHD